VEGDIVPTELEVNWELFYERVCDKETDDIVEMMERGELGMGSFKTGHLSAHSPNKRERVKEFNFNATFFISELNKHRRRKFRY
jgi:hypothetical protein